MSNHRLQFGIRGLFVLTLAIACFLGGWTAHDRMQRAEAERLKIEEDRLVKMKLAVIQAWEKQANVYLTRANKAEHENTNLKQQVGVLKYVVKTQKAEIEEITASTDRPPE